MRRLLLPLLIAFFALFSAPDRAQAQCNGNFGANTVCGSIPGGLPGPVPFANFPASGGNVTWINVKTNCSATGNGSTDDTAAINTCIGLFNTATNGVLYFPAGTYKTTSALTAVTANGIITGDSQSGLRAGAIDNPASVIQSTSTTAQLFTVNSQALLFRDLSLQNTSGAATTGSAGIFVTSSDVNQKVDYLNITVARFNIDIDIKVGQIWSMVNTTLWDPVQHALRINNTINADAGDWSIVNSQFIESVATASDGIRIEGSGGGKISNIKINGGSGVGFTNGINVVGGAGTVDLLIMNSSIENVGLNGINVSGSWPNIILTGLEISSFTPTGTHGINISGTSNVTISDITSSGGFTGTFINLSSCTNCYVNGIMGVASPFGGGTKPDHDGSGGIATFYFQDETLGTESRADWIGPSGQYTELRVLENAGTTNTAAMFTAQNDIGSQTRMVMNGSTVGGGFGNQAQWDSSTGISITSDSGVSTGGSDNISVRAGGSSQEALLVQSNGHLNATGQNQTAPSLTAGCNGAGSSVTGTDTAGTVTGQTAAATTCTLTFGHAFAAAPFCVATGNSSPLTGAVTAGTGTLVVNFASTANYKFTYICFGK